MIGGWGTWGLIHSGAPIAGFAVLVRNCQNQEITAFLCVDHAVGESPQAAATNLLCEGVPGFGVLFDELEGLECFNQEGISKSRRL